MDIGSNIMLSNSYLHKWKVLYSKQRNDWGTPRKLFNKLKNEFNFVLDAATTEDNPLGTKYFFTAKDNSLKNDWLSWTFCNPPYNIADKFVQKAYYENKLRGISSVLLLPNRTDNIWFHKYVWDRFNHKPLKDVQVRFLKGRLTFHSNDKNDYSVRNTAPFGSILVIFY